MADHQPWEEDDHAHHHHEKHVKADKGNTIAERCVWMSRTSDVLGSHVKSDLESYLTLIRRKIQERCGTTVELIQQIRRYKVSDSAHVTPNEFRFTLIKFGIILDQSLVDRIFHVFDSDRSGTMDFDEFAMWIMNSEFQPKEKNSMLVTRSVGESPRSNLRKKFLGCVNEHQKAFANMKKSISIIDFVSEISRKNMGLTDREARAVFQELDPRDTGYVETANLVKYAKTGTVDLRPTKPVENNVVETLEELLRRIVGRNTMALEKAFLHVKRGSGVQVPFEEFRRCLLNGGGFGKNVKDAKMLYAALGGKTSGGADIDKFFDALMPILTDPRTEISVKKVPENSVNLGRADRTLRDAMRHTFAVVKGELEAADSAKTGFVSSNMLYKILIKNCCPLTMQDYRFIMQELGTDPDSATETRVDYRHFLHSYNPLKAPHILKGYQTLKEYDSSPTKTDIPTSIHGKGKLFDMSGLGLNHKPSTTSGQALDTGRASGPTSRRPSRSSSSSSIGTVPPSRGGGTIGTTFNFGGDKDLLKKVWQGVLRKCHGSDPSRSGNVSRTEFISALESANFGKSMNAESMNRLADSYTLSNGLVNYLMCFRSYLGDLSSQKTIKSLNADSEYDSPKMSPSKTLKPLQLGTHPWEFSYERKAAHKQEASYWQQASLPKDVEKWKEDIMMQTTLIPPPNEKLSMTDAEKKLLLVQNKPEIQLVCARTYKIIAPLWRQLRTDFKASSIKNLKGCMLTSNFISTLDNTGLTLNKNDLKCIVTHFRGFGNTDVVKYDEFLRMCLVTKDQQEPTD
jgi:Ca2+-binding EF-hand superfamily protein